MTDTIDAIYSGGVFRPVKPVDGLADNARVRLTVTSSPATARPFADWVGTLPDDEARDMIRLIEAEFEQVNPDEWK